MPTSSLDATSSRHAPDPFEPYPALDDGARATRGPAAAAPPLGVRPLVDRFGKASSAHGEPVITPQPGQLVAPLRASLRAGRLARLARLPAGGAGAKAQA